MRQEQLSLILDLMPGSRWSLTDLIGSLEFMCNVFSSRTFGVTFTYDIQVGVPPYHARNVTTSFGIRLQRRGTRSEGAKSIALRYTFTGHALEVVSGSLFYEFIHRDFMEWAGTTNLPTRDHIDAVLDKEVGRVWDAPGMRGCQLGRTATLSPHYVDESIARSALARNTDFSEHPQINHTQPAQGACFSDLTNLLDLPPKDPQICSKCLTSELTNFIRHDGVVFCLQCHVSKKCADCDQPENLEFYTSQKDGREICAECFRKLNAQSRARERGFKINGERWVDRESEQKAALRRRRVENSIAYAQGLQADGLATTKLQAEGIMKVAGCRYVREALEYVGFHTPGKDLGPWDRVNHEGQREDFPF